MDLRDNKCRAGYPVISLGTIGVRISGQCAADRLKELDQLRKEGLVTDEKYRDCRRKALEALVGAP